jgi:ribonuclease HI
MGMEELRYHMCTFPNAETMVQTILELETEIQTLICCTLWCWWTGRNKLNAEGQRFSVDEVVRQGRYWAVESLRYSGTEQKEIVVPTQERWVRPAEDTIKINVDGSFSHTTRRGGWGFIARDHMGMGRGAGLGCLTSAASALHAEAIACQEAVHAAADWGMVRVQIETDCTNLVQAIQSNKFDFAPEGVIFRDIRSFVQLHFISFDISFSPRTCNKIAHVLASCGASQDDYRQVWTESVPEHVSVMVTSESAESLEWNNCVPVQKKKRRSTYCQ